MSSVSYDKSSIKTFRRQMDELEAGRVKVGLLASTAGRVADQGRIDNNPSLGLVHEMGQPEKHIPPRSFLGVPLTMFLPSTLRKTPVNWIKMLRTIGAKRTLGFLGGIAENEVQEAFSTRGHGDWPALKPATVRRKGSSAVLIESAQLRKAVTSEVVV